jgi:cytoskeletal protein CcmA (bactofilin family)
MSASSPPSTPPPAAPPVAAPPRPPSAPAPPPPKPPRSGDLRDEGVARHDSVHAVRWTTHGAVKVLGEVDVGEARLAGPTSVAGAISADSLRVDGALDAAAGLTVTGPLVADGSLRVRGPVSAGEAELRGLAHLQSDLKVERGLTVHGALHATGVRAGSVVLDGAAEVPGEVEAGPVDLRFREDSRVGTIRASSVRLALRPPNPVEMVLGRGLRAVVLHVEAESVEVDGVDVRFVRSPSIVLGRNAHVTEFEGKIVRRHASARVGPESRSPPPYGLSR